MCVIENISNVIRQMAAILKESNKCLDIISSAEKLVENLITNVERYLKTKKYVQKLITTATRAVMLTILKCALIAVTRIKLA